MRTILVLAAVTTAAAGAARAEPTASTTVDLPTGLAVGAELGDPASATVRFVTGGGRLGGGLAIGTGTLGGPGLSLRGEVTYAVTTLARRPGFVIPLYLGAGVRHLRHGYAPASMDELPDAHTGLLVGASAALAFHHLELYVEATPGYDVWRTASCSLASGATSVCPHAMASPLFIEAFAGARWYLGGRP